jgi:hypothetical protein
MAKVIVCPNKNHSGESCGIIFNNGMGLSDNEHRINEFRQKGYTIEDESTMAGMVKTMTDPELKLFHAYNAYVDSLGEAVQEVHSMFNFNAPGERDLAIQQLVRIARTYLLVDDSPRFTPYFWIVSGNKQHLNALKNRKV